MYEASSAIDTLRTVCMIAQGDYSADGMEKQNPCLVRCHNPNGQAMFALGGTWGQTE